jgi:hypothetical protein
VLWISSGVDLGPFPIDRQHARRFLNVTLFGRFVGRVYENNLYGKNASERSFADGAKPLTVLDTDTAVSRLCADASASVSQLYAAWSRRHSR